MHVYNKPCESYLCTHYKIIAKASPSSSTTSGPAGELRGFLRKHNSGARLEIDSDLTPTPPKKRKPIGYESDRGGHTRMRVQGGSSRDAGKRCSLSVYID